MLKNGKASCGSKSRHIHIRYFFTKDVIDRDDMELKHCPTEDMIVDFYTKLLQGKNYYKMRQVIMGHSTMPAEEPVGEHHKNATEHSTDPTVRKKVSSSSSKHIYKVSNNFD